MRRSLKQRISPTRMHPDCNESGSFKPCGMQQSTCFQAGGSPQLKNVSFHFGRGARILVVGANGAGKSTLLSILGA